MPAGLAISTWSNARLLPKHLLIPCLISLGEQYLILSLLPLPDSLVFVFSALSRNCISSPISPLFWLYSLLSALYSLYILVPFLFPGKKPLQSLRLLLTQFILAYGWRERPTPAGASTSLCLQSLCCRVRRLGLHTQPVSNVLGPFSSRELSFLQLFFLPCCSCFLLVLTHLSLGLG